VKRRNLIIWRKNLKAYAHPRRVKALLKNIYQAEVIDVDDANLLHDCIIQKNSQTITAEVKERMFDKNHTNPHFYYSNDILIELIQHMDRLAHPTTCNPKTLMTGFCWFFKSASDRLIYISYLDDDKNNKREVRVWDFDYKQFKPWLFDNMFRLSHTDYKISNKTTGALNISVPIDMVPERLYKEYKFDLGD
jgi:hypothetical protein